MPNWIVYDLRRTYLTCAVRLGLPPCALKGLVNHKQPTSDVTEGYLNLTPERLREPAHQVEDALLKLARSKLALEHEGGDRVQVDYDPELVVGTT